MRIWLFVLTLLIWLAATARAQETPALILLETAIGSQPDGFGGEAPSRHW